MRGRRMAKSSPLSWLPLGSWCSVQLGQFTLEPDDMHLLRRTLTGGTGDIESLRKPLKGRLR